MSALKVGDVEDGYVYLGGDPTNQDSWKEHKPEPSTARKALQALSSANEAVGQINKNFPVNPVMYGLGKGSEAVQSAGHLLEQGAYNVGGKVTDVTGSPGAGYAANVATQAVPSILSGSAMQHAANSVLKPAGRFFMQSALKPDSKAIASGDAAKAVKTLLDEGINVTPGGVAKLDKMSSDLHKQVQDLISQAEAAGVKIDKAKVGERAQDAIEQFKNQVTPQSDLATVKKAWEAFMNNPAIKELDQIPVAVAQKMKTGTYSILGSKPYGELKGADIETQKHLARGLKEEIEQAIPGVGPINKKMSEYLNALEQTGSRVDKSGNKNPISLAALAENPVAGAAFMLDRSELVKSILGRFFHNAAPSIIRDSTRVGTAGAMGLTQ